nr:hypothetical protein [Streptomyces buecherae]
MGVLGYRHGALEADQRAVRIAAHTRDRRTPVEARPAIDQMGHQTLGEPVHVEGEAGHQHATGQGAGPGGASQSRVVAGDVRGGDLTQQGPDGPVTRGGGPQVVRVGVHAQDAVGQHHVLEQVRQPGAQRRPLPAGFGTEREDVRGVRAGQPRGHALERLDPGVLLCRERPGLAGQPAAVGDRSPEPGGHATVKVRVVVAVHLGEGEHAGVVTAVGAAVRPPLRGARRGRAVDQGEPVAGVRQVHGRDQVDQTGADQERLARAAGHGRQAGGYGAGARDGALAVG